MRKKVLEKEKEEKFCNIFSKHTCAACSAAIPKGKGLPIDERELEVCDEQCKRAFVTSETI